MDRMDIRSNLPLQSLAGTSRALTHGSDKDRPAAGGGVAESQRNLDNPMEQGARSEDRDADGRQLSEPPPRKSKHSAPAAESAMESAEQQTAASRRPPSLDPSQGTHLDLDA